MLLAITVTLAEGIGAWGNNIPVGWAFGITNFVWWIGIGHAGTLISAILFLFQQRWRTAINRFSEAMTIFAVMCAGLFPLLHTGRPWFAYFMFPYPSTLEMWPQFKSPLIWDVFAVSTYFTVSLLFWYLGLIPDLASLRDASKSPVQRKIYGIFALGWRGSGRHWHNYKVGYLLLAGLSTPLVVSVHTIVSFDFAVSLIPGWHTTIFPPYFVAGAVFSGFAMVMSWMVPARHFLGLKHVITMRHLENMNKIILATGMLVSYGYLMEHFIAWYSGNQFEWFVFFNRATGPVPRRVLLDAVLQRARPADLLVQAGAHVSIPVMFIASIFVNIGMWCERFVIIVTSLHRDFLPAAWDMFYPTWVDITLVPRDHRLLQHAVPPLPQVHPCGRGERGEGAQRGAPAPPGPGHRGHRSLIDGTRRGTRCSGRQDLRARALPHRRGAGGCLLQGPGEGLRVDRHPLAVPAARR